MNRNISSQTKIVNTNNLYTTDIEQVFNLIRNGYNPSIDLRKITQQIQVLSDHNEQNKLKIAELPYVCFNGVFEHRNNGALLEYSNYAAIDFDGFQSERELQSMIAYLRTTTFVKFLFRSPSGRGIKAIIEHTNTNPKKHYALYQELLDMFRVPQIDPKTSDLSRATFLCYDPDAVWNNYCQPYVFDESKYQEQEYSVSVPGTKHRNLGMTVDFNTLTLKNPTNITDGSIERILGAWLKKENVCEGNRNDTMYRYACILCKAGVKWDYSLDWLNKMFCPYGIGPEEILSTATSAYTRYYSVFGSERDSKFGKKK